MSDERRPFWNSASLTRLLIALVLNGVVMALMILPSALHRAGASSPDQRNTAGARRTGVAQLPPGIGAPISTPGALGSLPNGAQTTTGAPTVNAAFGGVQMTPPVINSAPLTPAPRSAQPGEPVVPAPASVVRPTAVETIPGICRLVDEAGANVCASAVAIAGNDIFFLGAESLWVARGAAATLPSARILQLTTLKPPKADKLQGVPVQEFLSAVFHPARQSIVVLDKSGSLYEFALHSNSWKLLRANKQTLGTPDPHYVSVAVNGSTLLLLDPERNQIWRFPPVRGSNRYFRDVMPWRARPGDPFVADCIGMVQDGATFVLRRGGHISRYASDTVGGNGSPVQIHFVAPKDIRPSTLATAAGAPLYLIERENNRVLSIPKGGGAVQHYLFPSQFDLRTVLPVSGGFFALGGAGIMYRPLAPADSATARPAARRQDVRLDGLTIPVKGAHLPAHTGVFPGARRLYRHGVHQGLDFFCDAGKITMNTPAIAAEAGKVIRADVAYKDMDAKTYSKVVTDCEKEQFCSEANEDLFRGCQVWIDHGGGLITRYAHLNKARADLKPGMHVNRGEVIGYIGVSGTGENNHRGPGHPHLHFEIWLDGHYLGYGLNPAETVGVYEDIFGRIGKRGN